VNINKLQIDGSWIIDFHKFEDHRGYFFESFKLNECVEGFARPLTITQANTSLSKKGSIRGIHYALIPPSQAKFIQCQKGSIIDFVVDIRIGSPTFGTFQAINLNSNNPQAVFIEEGLAHAFVALEDETIVTYLINQNYNPEREKGINPFDSQLSISWPKIDLILSKKDKNEISLSEAQKRGILPNYKECKEYIKSLN
jgi:dTDP-4-dehydrorhamnose 3,5-epimerase